MYPLHHPLQVRLCLQSKKLQICRLLFHWFLSKDVRGIRRHIHPLPESHHLVHHGSLTKTVHSLIQQQIDYDLFMRGSVDEGMDE